jgi:hypothetical protein
MRSGFFGGRTTGLEKATRAGICSKLSADQFNWLGEVDAEIWDLEFDWQAGVVTQFLTWLLLDSEQGVIKHTNEAGAKVLQNVVGLFKSKCDDEKQWQAQQKLARAGISSTNLIKADMAALWVLESMLTHESFITSALEVAAQAGGNEATQYTLMSEKYLSLMRAAKGE